MEQVAIVVALTQQQTTAMMAQVVVMALLTGLGLALTRRRTEWLDTARLFLALTVVLTALVDAGAGWYVILLWLIFSVVSRALPAAVDTLRG